MMAVRQHPKAEAVSADQATITLSLPEIGGLCTRAARGAGLSWGLAEECGTAAIWLAANGFACAQTVSARLNGARGADVVPARGAWQSTGPVCGLCAGVTLADFAGLPEGLTQEDLTIGCVLNPLMMLPFIARAVTAQNIPVAVYLNGALWLNVAGDTVAIADHTITSAPTGDLCLHPTDAPRLSQRPKQHSVPVSRTDYTSLDALALHTTVPASAQSHARAGGEGPDTD